jgi:hypothetical protein
MPRKTTTETKAVKAAAAKPVLAKPAHKPRARKTVKPAAVFSSVEHQNEIARQAYCYWLDRGCAHGHSTEDWLRAETEVRQRWEAQQSA